MLGADGGITEEQMRAACNLEPREDKEDRGLASVLPALIDPSQEETAAASAVSRTAGSANPLTELVLDYCASKSRDWMTQGMWKYIKLPALFRS